MAGNAYPSRLLAYDGSPSALRRLAACSNSSTGRPVAVARRSSTWESRSPSVMVTRVRRRLAGSRASTAYLAAIFRRSRYTPGCSEPLLPAAAAASVNARVLLITSLASSVCAISVALWPSLISIVTSPVPWPV